MLIVVICTDIVGWSFVLEAGQIGGEGAKVFAVESLEAGVPMHATVVADVDFHLLRRHYGRLQHGCASLVRRPDGAEPASRRNVLDEMLKLQKDYFP
jgi:hypothetical protein